MSDKTEADVPKIFFENFNNLQLELFKQYNVFWSPQDRDTPSKLMVREYKILHVDEIKRSFNNKQKSIPLSYYFEISREVSYFSLGLWRYRNIVRLRRGTFKFIESGKDSQTSRNNNNRNER